MKFKKDKTLRYAQGAPAMGSRSGQTLRRAQGAPAVGSRSGQSTVEYILVVAAVIAVIIVATTGNFKTRLTNTVDTATSGMEDMANRLHGATNPP